MAHYMTPALQLQELEESWAEPLHEYSQFANIIKKLLVYRHQKHVQYEMTQENLDAKREQLDELEKSEREARRLEEALGRGRVGGYGSSTRREESATEEASPGEDERQDPEPSYLPPHPGPSPLRRRAPGMGFLNALSYTLHGMMDVDPATARRNGITKSRENISQVNTRLVLHSTFFWIDVYCSRSWRMPYILPLKI